MKLAQVGSFSLHTCHGRPFVLVYFRQKRRFPRVHAVPMEQAKAEIDALFDD